jgi:ribosome biogenesis protein Nip4
MFVKGDMKRYAFLDEHLPGVMQLVKGRILVVSKLDKERLFLVSKELFNTIHSLNVTPYSVGIYFAEVNGEDVSFSFWVADNYVKMGRKLVFVNRYGEEKFLYKRNLNKKHIIKTTGDIKPGDLVVVVNQRKEALGFGRALFSSGNLRDGRLVEHISDKGYFVKH